MHVLPSSQREVPFGSRDAHLLLLLLGVFCHSQGCVGDSEKCREEAASSVPSPLQDCAAGREEAGSQLSLSWNLLIYMHQKQFL